MQAATVDRMSLLHQVAATNNSLVMPPPSNQETIVVSTARIAINTSSTTLAPSVAHTPPSGEGQPAGTINLDADSDSGEESLAAEGASAVRSARPGKVTIEKARAMIENMGGVCISKECNSCRAELEVRCLRGHQFTETYKSIIKRKNTGRLCRECSGSIRQAKVLKRKMGVRESTANATKASLNGAHISSAPSNQHDDRDDHDNDHHDGDEELGNDAPDGAAAHKRSKVSTPQEVSMIRPKLRQRVESVLTAEYQKIQESIATGVKDVVTSLYAPAIASGIEHDVRTSASFKKVLRDSVGVSVGQIVDHIIRAANQHATRALDDLDV